MLRNWLKKRGAHYPIQYLRGLQEFYGREFRVAPGVLIPRPETETVVETALAYLRHLTSQRILAADIGTGSGCIAVTLACEDRRLRVLATDVSTKALRMARENARRLGCPASCVSFVQADVLPEYAKNLDLIVSNPPYVNLESRDTVDLSVRKYEPTQAVFSEDRGLAVYRRIFSRTRQTLKTSGLLLLELGSGMLEDVVCSAKANAWHFEASFPDLAGIQRCAVFSKD